jgi:S-adenosylmethionine:tRNA ribosyltransferase-isomerase
MPTAVRDQSRLMVLDRSGGTCRHHVFRDLPDLLRPGDLLVLNDTAVIPARFFCRRRTGGKVEGLFLQEVTPGLWEVMLKGAGRCREGEVLEVLGQEGAKATMERRGGPGLWRLAVDPPVTAAELLGRIGRTPLPPYIRRPRATDDGRDRLAYQTVYAARPGAVAAPTAGLHFTRQLLDALAGKGVETTCLTLHVGLGTFAPVKSGSLERHRMHAEWYELTEAAAGSVARAKVQGRRVVAVGTTTVRALESAARTGTILPHRGRTDLFIYPPFTFRLVDALITNFHLPRSTLLMLVAAFCAPGSAAGVKMILDAYAQAVSQRYRFYSYGDAMLIL